MLVVDLGGRAGAIYALFFPIILFCNTLQAGDVSVSLASSKSLVLPLKRRKVKNTLLKRLALEKLKELIQLQHF